MDDAMIAKALGSFNEQRPSDARVDRAGARIARKVCMQDDMGQRSVGNIEIANELFPYVVIAGGTAMGGGSDLGRYQMEVEMAKLNHAARISMTIEHHVDDGHFHHHPRVLAQVVLDGVDRSDSNELLCHCRRQSQCLRFQSK